MKKLTSYKFGAASFALGVAIASTPAMAQGQPTTETLEAEGTADATNDQGLIVVTGSRIAQPQVESSSPLQIIDDAAIDDSGAINVQELLLENPVFGSPALNRTNAAFLTSGTGVATVDLRDLGSDRTLVLVNGRRVVSSLAGSSTVDLNVIPTQFINRVDILTGGASSLYGSDAIAGVVNFVYKKDFQGIEANGQYGLTEEGDDVRYQANVTAGTDFVDGAGNIMVHFGYSNEKGLLSRQRENTRFDDFDLFRFTGDPADFGTSVTPFFSSFPPQGRFITSGGTFTYDDNGNVKPGFSTNGPDLDGDGFGDGDPGADGFNRQNFRTLAVPVERYVFAAAGEYEISDGLNFFFEGTYNKTKSSRIIEPFPLESGGANGIFPTDGGFNIENIYDGDVVRNPYVPDEIFDAATDSNGDGLRDIGFTRRLAEFGTRSGTTERDFYRFVLGFDGDIGERFRWDVSYNYGNVSENQISSGQVNVVNFRDALAAITDVDDLNGNGLTNDVVCLNAEARANGCSPANIFGFGSLSQGAVNYIQAQGTYQTGITQQVIQGNISGSLFDLPAGPVGIAAGFEYRKESSFSDNDALTNQGLNAGNVLPDTSGSFDVREGFVELRVPLLADTTGFELLEIGGAARVSDYSTVGTVYSYSGTVVWQPVQPLRLRGTYARAVRAPNVSELFSGLSQTFPSGLTDPCENIGATGGGAIGTNCRADAGVAANIAANGVFTLNQSDLQGISGFNGGNPNLEEEESTSYTGGAVLSLGALGLGNATITADYYNIEVENVIGTFPRQFTLDQCYGQGNQTFCDLITRRQDGTAVNSAGSIDLINALAVNSATLETEGLDITGNVSFPLGLVGQDDRIALRGAYTHIFKYDYTPIAGADADPSDGEIGTAKDRFTLNAAYLNEDFKISLTGTYIGKSYEDDQFCAAFDLEPECISVSDEFYLDLQTTFYAADALEFYVGVDNLLDNDAPSILSGTSYNNTGTDTAAGVYDLFGRRYYAGVRLQF